MEFGPPENNIEGKSIELTDPGPSALLRAHERLFGDWENEGYKPEVLEKAYHKNTQRIFGFAL